MNVAPPKLVEFTGRVTIKLMQVKRILKQAHLVKPRDKDDIRLTTMYINYRMTGIRGAVN